MKSFGNWNEQTKTWSGVFDLSQLNADDKEDIKDALEELPEKLSQEKVFQGAKEDELFWRESVTAPIEQTSGKREGSQHGGCFGAEHPGKSRRAMEGH